MFLTGDILAVQVWHIGVFLVKKKENEVEGRKRNILFAYSQCNYNLIVENL